ncbi:serine/threonine-protein phosphatase 6 regulatory ankyrin repeat subunit B isoform X7 [Hydra vulgaris]
MSNEKKSRHHKSEINLAIFLFQSSYQGNYRDLKDVVNSEKIKKEKRWLALNAHDAEGVPILINCIQGSAEKVDEGDHLECLKILSQTGIPLDAKDKQGRTALHWSIINEKYEICWYLLKQGAKGHTVESKNNFDMSPLHLAVSRKLVKFVKLVLGFESQKQYLNCADSSNTTPLCHALLKNDLEIFQLLLAAGADMNSDTNNGKSLVAHVIENNQTEFLNLLLKHKVNLFPLGTNQYNMIHLAANQQNSASLKLLASHCTVSELQSKDKDGKTPLMHAVYHSLVKNVKILLDSQVDAMICCNVGKTALHLTCFNSDKQCVDLLLKYEKKLLNKCDFNHCYPIHSAIIFNNQVIVRALLDHGANASVLDNEKHTLIHYATEYASTLCLMELVSVGLSVNIPDQYGVYPIHYAVNAPPEGVSEAKVNYLKQLVKVNADLSVIDEQGCQPIHWAVCTGNIQALKILLIENVDPNITASESSLSCLHLACKFQKLECLELLTQHLSIKIDQLDNKGRSALFLACEIRNTSKFTEILLNAGADCDRQDQAGNTPSHIAVINSSVDSLWLLSLKRANIDVKNNLGETPLHLACMNADDGPLRFLLTRNCNVNSQQLNGSTPLHLSVSSKSYDRTLLLLQKNANCNVLMHGKDEYTPLDLALENGNYKLIKLLRSYGAQTGHCVLSNAAIKIQHYWKMYRKRCFPKFKERISNRSLCNSSNASESISVLESKRNQNQTDQEVGFYQALLKNSVDHSESILNTSPINSIEKFSSSQKQEFAQNLFTDILTERYKKEFKERIAEGNHEIELMRKLMRETEKLLVRAKTVSQVSEDLISSDAFRSMKRRTKLLMDDQRKKYLFDK